MFRRIGGFRIVLDYCFRKMFLFLKQNKVLLASDIEVKETRLTKES